MARFKVTSDVGDEYPYVLETDSLDEAIDDFRDSVRRDYPVKLRARKA
jgi:hypothetical protein